MHALPLCLGAIKEEEQLYPKDEKKEEDDDTEVKKQEEVTIVHDGDLGGFESAAVDDPMEPISHLAVEVGAVTATDVPSFAEDEFAEEYIPVPSEMLRVAEKAEQDEASVSATASDATASVIAQTTEVAAPGDGLIGKDILLQFGISYRKVILPAHLKHPGCTT